VSLVALGVLRFIPDGLWKLRPGGDEGAKLRQKARARNQDLLVKWLARSVLSIFNLIWAHRQFDTYNGRRAVLKILLKPASPVDDNAGT